MTKEILYNLYITQGKSTTDIANIYNTYHSKIGKLLKKFNIHIRTFRESQLTTSIKTK